MKKTIKYIYLLGALFFLFEFTYAPLLHNHPPDIYDHYNCPAYILSVTLVSFAVTIFLVIKLTAPFKKRIVKENTLIKPKVVKFNVYSHRAPPL